ncbi:DUF305 domain-containing protein [Sphaerospermopsis aphanizomenoides BCCUSP55]|uniref:DUF305 domain-containing protein n=1 Tax=Sphaerospermopsis aphanizomenoides TaxID=459663 RepID=UPI001904060F|nr:DUF305 domain-containing protein [Sphaerospermopsis aphanizomenoides]MBK1988253.1 DUF305 domain-containing protein [Sphaerospermopsis aphanizomenoides BCCUSP55]
MFNKLVNYGFLGLVVALSLTNSVQAQPHQHSPSAPTGETNAMPQQQGDQHFLKMMVHHDQKTLKMADLAVQKAKNTQIKALATQIKADQTQEIEQLQALYKQLYATEVPADAMNCMVMGQGMAMKGMMNLESLQNAPNFDQEFLRKMIHHQQMSVNMAKKAAQTANVPQIRDLAQAIIKTQTAQIQKLQQLSSVES